MSVDTGERFQVKRLTVKPGEKLSLQKHFHRSEHWVVVHGTAMVERDGESMLVRENESVYIPIGAAHRLGNPGKRSEEQTSELQSLMRSSYAVFCLKQHMTYLLFFTQNI